MALNFQVGDPTSPRGHALLYFEGQEQPPRYYATYIIVLPISIDMVKYMPPFLAPHAQDLTNQDLSAFAFPPIPESVENLPHLKSIAQLRSDDVLYGGSIDSGQTTNLLASVNEIVQEYGQVYLKCMKIAPPNQITPNQEEAVGLGVNEVLYELMGDRDRLNELSRLVGKLRFAVEGNDQRQIQEAQDEVQLLAKSLPIQYKIPDLVEAAKTPSRAGGELAHLCLERCYKLADEDYVRLRELEDRIEELETNQGNGTP